MTKRNASATAMAAPFCLTLFVFFSVAVPVHAGAITNGDFETGDLTGWDANTLNPPGSTPVSVGVASVDGSFVGQVNFSSTVGGFYAGSLSQDFYSGAATALTFNFGYSADLLTAGQGIGVDTLDIELFDLDTNTLLYHPLHAQNDATGLEVQTNGLAASTILPLSGSNTHLRVALLMDLHTVDGLASSVVHHSFCRSALARAAAVSAVGERGK